MRNIPQNRSILTSTPSKKLHPRISSGSFFEALEERKLLSGALLGVGAPPLAFNLPTIKYDSTGRLDYTPATNNFEVSATVLTITTTAGNRGIYDPTQATPHPDPHGSFHLKIQVDNNGNLIGGSSGNDFQLDGWVDMDNSGTQNAGDIIGTLLTGEVAKFGYQDNQTTTASDFYDFILVPTGGLLVSQGFYTGKSIGVTMNSAPLTGLNPLNNNDWTKAFSEKAQGVVGPISPLTPAIHLVKFTNNTDNDTAPGLQLSEGDAVTWEYTVTNPGQVPLLGVVVTDDNGTPGDTSDDFTALPVLDATNTHNIGDTHNIGQLDTDETWKFVAPFTTAAVVGQYTNLGTVNAHDASGTPVSSSNPDNYNASKNPGPPPPITVGDFVWVDSNENGVQDSGEPGIPNVTLTLTGTDSDGHSVTDHQTTDGTGHYLFTENSGTYTVTVDASNFTGGGALAPYIATPTLTGADRGVDSNVNPSGTTPVLLPPGSSDLTLDFGYYQNVTVGDFVWSDTNDNGIQDSGENGINGVTLTLTGTDGSGNPVTDHQTTSGNGGYLFTEKPGAYTVTVDASNFTGGGALASYIASPTLVGGDRSVDSNANPSGTTPSALPGGSSDLTIDFGYYLLQPSIHIIKLTNGTNNDAASVPGTPNGPVVPVGSTVTWTYDVTTTGNEPIKNVVVTDNITGVSPAPVLSGGFNVGDSNNDGLLESGETWVYTASGLAIAGQYENFGTVNGNGNITNTPVTDTNVDHYFAPVPAINTVANGTVVIGSGTKLGDTAVLSGGVNPTGTITFTLYNASHAALYTDVVTANGNGSYTTDTGSNPGGYLPTDTGSYLWSATYSGDSHQGGATDNGVNESETVTPAGPAINTVAGGTVVIGSGTKLGDTAVLSGGFNPSGTITFTLYSPTNVAIYTDVVTANGNGTYTTATGNNPGGYLPTDTGSYLWSATYSGDSNNNGASDNGVNESEAVTPAGPAINTVAGGTVVIGSGTKLGDTAVLSGGFNPTGTITFTVYNSSNVALYTDVVVVSGNGSYTTDTGNNPGGYLPTSTGNYLWTATYSGDSNNSGASDNGVNESEAVTSAVPAINTVAGGLAVLGSGTKLTDTAVLSGAYNATGTITFTLYSPSSVAVYTDVVTANGNGSYTTATGNNPGGYLPSVSGTYLWSATYSGDANNSGATDNGVNENETVVNPQIKIVKLTNGTDNDVPTGPLVPVGSTVAWTYNVTNPGDEAIANVVVTDNIAGVTPTAVLSGGFNVGDSNHDSLLEPGEQWVFTASGIAVLGQYTNLGTVNGNGAISNTPVTSNNPDNYFGIKPGIDIEKTTNGPSNSNPTAPDYDNEDAASGAGVPILVPGSAVTWTYKVTNTGNTNYAFSDVVIVDDNGTPANTADDLKTTNGQITFQSVQTGDADNILEPGEVWIYKATGVVQNVAQPAGPTATIDMTGNTATTGSAGNVRTFASGAVSVHASAFSRDSSGTWATAYLGSYGGGLGATDGSEDGSNNTHTVDNSGRDNYVLLEFNQNVVVDSAFLGYVVGDSDMKVWIGNINNAFNSHQSLNDLILSGLVTEVNAGGSSTRTANINAGNVSGNVLIIAADPGDAANNDFFKIQNVIVGTFVPGVYENKATVTVPGGLTDSDLSHYRNPDTNPGIKLVKKTNGTDNNTATGPVVNVGSTVTWTYYVTNTGNVPLTVSKTTGVVDDNGTPLNTADDFKATYTSGDTNSNGLLDLTETWLFTATGTAMAGQYENYATVTGKDSTGKTVCSTDLDHYFGQLTGTISGHKYIDQTGNGLSNDDKTHGFGGLTIKLYKDNNNNGVYDGGDTYISSTTTATTGDVGAYSFTGLTLGQHYVVQEVVPNGYLRTGPTNYDSQGADPTTGTPSVTGVDFANFLLDCDLSDFTNIYFVINGTTTVTDLRGNTHEGDTVTAYFTVKPGVDPHQISFASYTAPDSYYDANDASQQVVFDTDTGVFGPGQGSLTVQIPNSDYQIDLVCGAIIDKLGPAGSNIFYTPQGRLFSADNSGTEAQLPLSGFASLAGNVYADADNDGVIDSNEKGIGSVKVQLTGTNNLGHAVSLTRYTAPDGSYSFLGLRPGSYKISEVSPTDYTDGIDTLGNKGGTKGNDMFSAITLAAGANGTGYNFGELYKPSSLSGYVYCDSDKDGKKDSGEAGIKNVKITLTGTDCLGNAVNTYVLTDANGYYSFANLKPGSYTITETTQPAGYSTTSNAVGSLGGNKSGDSFSGIGLLSNQNGTGYNFGEKK